MNSKVNADRSLYLLPVWLGEHGGNDLLPPANIAVAERLDLFFAENERTARRMLRRMSPDRRLDTIEIHALDKDTPADAIKQYIRMLQARDGAIVSEAGMPAIADPGAGLVAAAHEAGIRVVPLAGPSSIL